MTVTVTKSSGETGTVTVTVTVTEPAAGATVTVTVTVAQPTIKPNPNIPAAADRNHKPRIAQHAPPLHRVLAAGRGAHALRRQAGPRTLAAESRIGASPPHPVAAQTAQPLRHPRHALPGHRARNLRQNHPVQPRRIGAACRHPHPHRIRIHTVIIAAGHRMVDGRLVAAGRRILNRRHHHRLRLIPVGRGEHKLGIAGAGHPHHLRIAHPAHPHLVARRRVQSHHISAAAAGSDGEQQRLDNHRGLGHRQIKRQRRRMTVHIGGGVSHARRRHRVGGRAGELRRTRIGVEHQARG